MGLDAYNFISGRQFYLATSSFFSSSFFFSPVRVPGFFYVIGSMILEAEMALVLTAAGLLGLDIGRLEIPVRNRL